MAVTVTKGQWYDEKGTVLSKEEKTALQNQIHQELDQELQDTGIEGWIKRFIKKQVNR